jgi:hypothetical protein
MAKIAGKGTAIKKTSFGRKKEGVQKKKRNKHESVKEYQGQGK